MLHEKSQSLGMFKIYKLEVENQLNRNIKAIRSDHGSEYYDRYDKSVDVHVDCIKIAEDKSSESRVCTPEARLIRAIYARSKRWVKISVPVSMQWPKRRAQSPHLRFTTTSRRVEQSPRLRSAEFEVRVSTLTQSSRPTAVPRCKVRSPRLDVTTISRCRA